MKHAKKYFALLLVFALLLSGCSDPEPMSQEQEEVLEQIFSGTQASEQPTATTEQTVGDESANTEETETVISNTNLMPQEILKYNKNKELVEQYIFEYDDLNRLIRYSHINHPSNNPGSTSECNITYDSDGRVILKTFRITDHDSTQPQTVAAYTYNSKGQLVDAVLWDSGRSETIYQYDEIGNCLSKYTTFEQGSTSVEYQYDSNGLLISIHHVSNIFGDTTEDNTLRVLCDEDGNVLEEVYDDFSIIYAYDEHKRLIKQEQFTGNQSEYLSQMDYSYDPFVIYSVNGYSYLSILDRESHPICELMLGNPKIISDSHKIQSIEDELSGHIYQFHYQDTQP